MVLRVDDTQEGDVMCHSTSKEKLLQVFQESGVLAWKEGKCQRIKGAGGYDKQLGSP